MSTVWRKVLPCPTLELTAVAGFSALRILATSWHRRADDGNGVCFLGCCRTGSLSTTPTNASSRS
eukprot:2718265-Prymnesium_polylepis.1